MLAMLDNVRKPPLDNYLSVVSDHRQPSLTCLPRGHPSDEGARGRDEGSRGGGGGGDPGGQGPRGAAGVDSVVSVDSVDSR